MHLSASSIRDSVAAGKMSASAVARGAISAIRSDDARIKAFLHVDEEGATEAAKAVNISGPLAGVPIAIKDNLCQRGVPTTASSKILAGFRPPYTASVVERLLAAGAIPVGKTNLDEFAMGSSTENSAFGPSRNPWDVTRTPGGSSGGSAAAVAARMVPVALGSDTGGSIRQPAALCGIVGLKPTYGRVSRYGLIAFASSLDQVGPLSLTVADSARVLGVIAGHDPLDATSSPRPVPNYLETLENGVKGLRLGIPREFFAAGLDPAIETCVREAIAVLEHAGATLVPIRLPHTEFGIAAYYVIAPCEASSNLARFDGVRYGHRTAASGNLLEMFRKSRTEGFGEEVRRRIMLGTFALSSGYYDAYYKKALQVRALIKRDFDEAFKSVDAIVGPTSPIPAFKLGEKSADPIAMYLCDVLTVTANLAGIPGISVPCGFTPAGLPAGLQILGRDWDEAGILKIARAYERETDWSQKEPTR